MHGDFLRLRKKPLSEVCRDEVEWFVGMVEERKKNNDHKKEKLVMSNL